MWLVSQGPETNYNSASLDRAPLGGQTCQKKSIIGDEPCLDVSRAIAHSEVQGLASWCKDHACQSLSFIPHLALTFLPQLPSPSTEFMMRHRQDEEIGLLFMEMLTSANRADCRQIQ